MERLTNKEILQVYLDNGLIRTCLECQFAKSREDRRYMEDFFQDLCIIILTYDNEKLNNAHLNNHFNAWVSRVIINNLFSRTSKYYKDYKKFPERSVEMTKQIMEETPDEH